MFICFHDSVLSFLNSCSNYFCFVSENMSVESTPEECHEGYVKKKVRRVEIWKQLRAKKLRNKGEGYVDHRGKIHEGKKLLQYDHQCRYNCNLNLPEYRRREIFDKYWNLGNWELQSYFFNGTIETVSYTHLDVYKRQV